MLKTLKRWFGTPPDTHLDVVDTIELIKHKRGCIDRDESTLQLIDIIDIHKNGSYKRTVKESISDEELGRIVRLILND